MNHLPFRLVVLALGGLMSVAGRAVTAIGLGSFEGIEEPLVRYNPSAGRFRPDDLVNITDLGGGTFRMFLRYRGDEWDADRDTQNKDRQRAEVKGLRPHQKTGETFDYTTTWRTNPAFRAVGRFCHVFQLKSTDGDSGAPLVTISLGPEEGRAEIRCWSGKAKTATAVREFKFQPGVWQTVCVRVKASNDSDGAVLASVDGDEFQGLSNISVFRPGATDYRPKWGLYRGVSPGLAMGDDYVEHKNVSAHKSRDSEPSDPDIERTARELQRDSAAKSLAWLIAQPPSPVRGATIITIVTDWATHDPAAAMTWTGNNAPADVRADAMLHVFNRWADRDVDSVLRWSSSRAPASWLDPLLWYFATDTTVRYTAREKALAGAALIAEPELRGAAIGHVVLIWARREPDAATRYVQGCAALTTAQKAGLEGEIAARRH